MAMLMIGYCFGIRSERRLCEEVYFDLGLSLILSLVPMGLNAMIVPDVNSSIVRMCLRLFRFGE